MNSPGRSLRVVRVIAVSPGDVSAERKRLQAVVDELNRTLAPDLGFELKLWRWETDASPGLHLEGPQGLIDEAMGMEDADIVVGMFWNRLGTPTHQAESGTAHELRRAWEFWRDKGRPQVFLYFSERKTRLKTAPEAAQLLALFEFRDAMPLEQMPWPYDTLNDFERAVRQHLSAHLRKLSRDPSASQDEKASAATVAGLMQLFETIMSGAVRVSAPSRPTAASSEDVEAFDSLTERKKDTIAAAIAGLPDAEKLVIAMMYYENISTDEIAEVLGVPKQTVHHLHETAIQRLRDHMQALPPAE